MSRTEAGAVANERRRMPARRHILTPEGVALPVDLADRSDRLSALLIDLTIVYGSLIAAGLLMFSLTLGGFSASWAVTIVLLVSFLVRSFYFVVFEMRWQGRTPGKRALGIRVIDRHGGPLRPDAVFARNLMREVEVFIPISLLFGLPAAGNPWFVLFLSFWITVLLFLPVFNRDRLRAGDMLAGTWVVKSPKQSLLPDVADTMASERAEHGAARGGLSFSRAQLDVYGIYELQTLETALRQTGPHAATARDEIAARIKAKISWQSPASGQDPDSFQFLEAFYTALRRHLETRLLFGERRQDKHHRGRTGNT